MAEGPLPETSDAAVRNFIEYVALGFVLEAIAAFYRGESAERVVGGLAIGAVMSFAGFKWKSIKIRMGPRFAQVATNVATDFRWWLAGAFVAFIYLGAPSFTRAIRAAWQQPIAAPPRSTSATDVVAMPPTPSPQEVLVTKGLSFSEQFSYNLRWDVLRLPRPCNLKILAPPGMEAPRGQLVSAAMNASVQILNRPNGYYIPVCQIVDEQKDRTPLLYGPHNFPPFGITIHTSESNIETREFLAEVFHSQSIWVTGDSVLPPNSPANLIYIEFGRSLVQAPK